MKRYVAIKLLCGLLPLAVLGCAMFPKKGAPTAYRGGLDPAAYPIIDELCQGAVDDGFAPGVVLLIGRDDTILMRKTYGYRMSEPKVERMTLDTLFDLASVTKSTCTSAAIMLLVQDGVIRLEDPVSLYVPEFEREDKENITIHQLLTHSSGLPAYTSASYLEEHFGPRPNPDGLIQRISELELKYEPSTDYTYSCLNYLTLARIAQNVTQRNMSDFLRERLWTPLGMKDTTFYPNAEQAARTAPTIYDEKQFRRAEVHDPLAYYSVCEAYAPGNAGGYSTVDDMSRYVRMLLGGGKLDGVRIYNPKIWQRITTDQNPKGISRRTCGWGVWTSESYATPLNEGPENLCLGHTGYTGNIVWMDKLSKAYVIMFSNCVYPVDKKENKSGIIAARKKVIRTVIDHLDIYQEVNQKQPAAE